jgi:nicotinamide riboside kinase
MLNVNLFGGPGTGKSTTASGLFYIMKKSDYQVEYIQEYAKELTFGKDFTKLSDQLLVLGEQHHRMYRLNGQVDFLIHDSPFVMGLTYLQDGIHLPKQTYSKLITELFASYDNLNIFLKRNIEEHAYQEYGRNQNLDEAIIKDNEIQEMLSSYNIPYMVIEMGKNSVDDIFNLIKEHNTNL